MLAGCLSLLSWSLSWSRCVSASSLWSLGTINGSTSIRRGVDHTGCAGWRHVVAGSSTSMLRGYLEHVKEGRHWVVWGRGVVDRRLRIAIVWCFATDDPWHTQCHIVMIFLIQSVLHVTRSSPVMLFPYAHFPICAGIPVFQPRC